MIERVAGYEELESVLAAAYKQAAQGKGAERHANDLPFHAQRMQGISQLLGSADGMAFQAVKKMTEGLGLAPAARERELLGAINYLAGMVVFFREQQDELECQRNDMGSFK